MSGAVRLKLVFSMSERARAITLAGIRQRRPDLNPAQAKALLLREILGPDLWARAYGNE